MDATFEAKNAAPEQREVFSESLKEKETPQERHERLVEEAAMKEEQEHFEAQYEKLEKALAEKQAELTSLIERARDGEEVKGEEVEAALQIKGEKGIAEALAKSVNEIGKTATVITPITEVVEALGIMVKDELSTATQGRIAQKEFAEKRSWYHTTEDGKTRLAEIEKEVSAK